MSTKRTQSTLFVSYLLSSLLISVAVAAPAVPTDIEQPGTQPQEVAGFIAPTNCDNCHGGTDNPAFEPAFGWRGGMMGNASRDPIFWATVAVAEQDFLPGSDPAARGGVGDLCIRCHSVGGWINGNSTPTDGSGLSNTGEADGVECEFCHLLVNPDPPVNVAGTVEEQNTPFEAYTTSGEPHFGSGQYVLNSEGTRLGPYSAPDVNPPHAFYGSAFHRGELCGTCHDVSNPAVGDLAHNHGAMLPLPAGSFSGVPGAPVTQKAAFNNPPYAYGIVERTFSEWKASALDTLRVNDYPTLPADLRLAGGSLDLAYHRAYDARSDADYEDGTERFYTCQTCHMAAATGVGCNKHNVPVRTDLPRHDQTGSGYWMPDVVLYQEDENTLRFGTGLNQTQRDALTAGKDRAEQHLSSAASLAATQVGGQLRVRVTNLTGHKLISGYPEGRRMWLNVRWLDALGGLIDEQGGYGQIRTVVNPRDSQVYPVHSIVDLDGTVIYEASPGMDAEWAAQLVALGYPSSLALSYDRMGDAVGHTLGELAAEPAGTAFHTFHFVLNNVVTDDNRIPPYGFSYDEALERSALPVPATRYGNPGAGGTYDHWDEVDFPIPPGAASAEVRLLYQQTSWEYVQFLLLANDGLSSFLGNEGVNMLDAWLNTGMSPPHEMALAVAGLTSTAGTPGEAPLTAGWNAASGQVEIDYTPACDATDHTIYYGDLDDVASYGYGGAACYVGVSGSAAFDPGSDSAFFLVVANDHTREGSYGLGVAGLERPEQVGTPVCDLPQDLAGIVCE